jgi:hypothetical protein
MPSSIRHLARAMTLALITIILCAPTIVAQQADPLVGLRERLDASSYRALQLLTDSARAAGLPTEPLISKVQEGLLKRASSPAIVAAARGLAVRLRQAREALGATASAAEIEAGASALRAGAAAAQLTDLRSTRGASRGIAVPLVVLADLLSRGVPRDTAARALQTMAAANATDAAFQALRLNIERDITGGMSPAAAAGLRYRALLERQP